MESGTLVDRGHGNAGHPQQWVPGETKMREQRFFGFRSEFVDTDGHEEFQVSSCRCTACGLVQLYALPTKGSG